MGDVPLRIAERGRHYFGSKQGGADCEASVQLIELNCSSKLTHLNSNLKSIANGPLPESLVVTIEAIWTELKAEKEDKYIY